MRIYIDNSALNRPFDDMAQPRIWFETLALSFVLSLVEFGEATLLRSQMHEAENRRNPNPYRREWVNKCLRLAKNDRISPNNSIVSRAKTYQNLGVKIADALHLAFADELKADYFLTCDDSLIKRYSGPMKVMNPTTFITTQR
jgi:predicted nucleic acid-binding protein